MALVNDPVFTDAELDAFGFAPYHLGELADAAAI